MGIQISDHENTNSRSGTEERETHVAAAGRQRAVAVLGREGQEQRPLGGGLTPLLPSPGGLTFLVPTFPRQQPMACSLVYNYPWS